MFTGCYVTGLPDGYLDNLSDLRSGRSREKHGLETIKAGGGDDGSLAGSGGAPVTAGGGQVHSDPDQREDIRHVV